MAKIRVALRVRPLSDREVDGGFPVVVAVEDNSAFITDIRVPERPKADSRARYRQFHFDHAFWLEENASEGAAQSEVYREMGPPLEKSILQGYNACLLAYGQSGTGKTHTMLGSKDDPGIIPRLCHNIWEKLKVKEDINVQGPKAKGSLLEGFRMEVSFMEIYREKVRDLLSPSTQLKLREHPQLGPHVQNLTRVEVTGEMGLLDLLWEGNLRRVVGTTGSNRRSSRSHAIWSIYLTRNSANNGSNCGASKKTLITNQVHLVDLAGSEKAGFTTAKNLLAEGADINRSLVALGNVISSLAEKTQYIPYRDSALTWLLKDSLGGNATTAIIITASPASNCHAQTLNSFRFAQRARLVENRPRINLSSPSALNSNGGVSSSAALYSVMSAFEIKKDISRLSKIIRSAQNFASIACYWAVQSFEYMEVAKWERWRIHNGGILRGLTPRASWTRLVSALEGWNQIEAEQVKLQRAASEDTTASSIVPPTNSSDAMIQADMMASSEDPSASSSKQSTPSRLIGTEVFIPCSNSIKCLTWQQEETHTVPKPAVPENSEEEEEYSSFKMTPPPTPTSSLKVHHLKYILPVQFPVNHHLDHASRISEKIHRSFTLETPQGEKLEPIEVPNYLCEGDSPLIRERIPTLVNPKEISPVLGICTSEKHISFYEGLEKMAVPVRCKSVDNCVQSDGFEWSDDNSNSESSSTLNETCIPNPKKSKQVLVYEKVDPMEIPQEEIKGSGEVKSSMSNRFRMVNKNDPKRHKLVLKMPPLPPQFTPSEKPSSFPFEEIKNQDEAKSLNLKEIKTPPCKYRMVSQVKTKNSEKALDLLPKEDTFYFNSESILPSPSPSLSSSSNSSTNPLNISPRRPGLVHVIPEESEEIDLFESDSISDLLNDLDLDLEHHPPVSTVCVDLDLLGVESESNNVCHLEEETLDNLGPNVSKSNESSINGATDSKFRNHFARELHEMDKIGKQLKQLQRMSQRFNVVKPFLDEISNLEKADHSASDDKLDAEIESCSGWNIDIEFQKVNSEISSLNKILKTGIVPSPSNSKWNNYNNHHQQGQRRDSTTTEASSSHQSTSTVPSTSQGSPSSPRILSSTFGRLNSNNTPKISHTALNHRRRSTELLIAAHSSHSEPLASSMNNHHFAPPATDPYRFPQSYQPNLYEFVTGADAYSHRNAHGSISYPHPNGHPPPQYQYQHQISHHYPYGIHTQPNFIQIQPGVFSPESVTRLNHVSSPPYFHLGASASSDWVNRVHSVSSNESATHHHNHQRNNWTPIDQISTCSSYQNYHPENESNNPSRSVSSAHNVVPNHSVGGHDCHGSTDFCSCHESVNNVVPNGHLNFSRSSPSAASRTASHFYSNIGIGEEDRRSSSSTTLSSNENLSTSRFNSSNNSHYGNMFTHPDYSSRNKRLL